MTTTDQPTATTIIVTDEAIAKVAELLATENEPGLGLRVAVRPGGCSGFSYEMFFDTDTHPSDHVTTFGSVADGLVTVRVDAASAPNLVGATLSYNEGPEGTGFSIDNPNAQGGGCGCSH